MSHYEFILPDIGEGVVEAEVIRWLVAEGEEIAEDQPMIEVMTDKATVQIPSPKKGRVAKRMVEEGQIALVGKVLVVFELVGGTTKSAPPASAKAGNGHAHGAHAPGPKPSNLGATAPSASVAPRVPQVTEAPSAAALTPGDGRALAAPATRRLARELGVDIQTVPGTGRGGRVTNEDVRAQQSGAPASAQALVHVPAVGGTLAPLFISQDAALEERIPLRGLRRKIAQKMSESKNTAAHFTYVDEVDMTELVALRARARKAAEDRGVKLTFLPFVAKAVIAALKRFPMLNATLDDARGEIVQKRYFHIGVAAATDDGLLVPVVRDADKKSLFDIAREIEALGEKARTGKLGPGEASGSTFTLTSLGKLGGLFATPIINHPEVAILGIHEIKKKPVVVDGQIVIRDIMLLSVSFDHRVIDGHVGAAFAQQVRAYLQDPHLLFLELV